jgi:hypothetical protein
MDNVFRMEEPGEQLFSDAPAIQTVLPLAQAFCQILSKIQGPQNACICPSPP